MNFHGMCVGGPMAGKMLTEIAPFHKIFLGPPLDSIPNNIGPEIEDIEQEIFTYVHVEGIRRHGCVGVDFWVDESGPLKNGWDVMHHLINFYSKTHENLRKVNRMAGGIK